MQFQWSKLLDEYVERSIQATLRDAGVTELTTMELEIMRCKEHRHAPYLWSMEGMENGPIQAHLWANWPDAPERKIPMSVLRMLQKQYGNRPLMKALIVVWSGDTYVVGDLALKNNVQPGMGDIVNFMDDVESITLFRTKGIDFDA